MAEERWLSQAAPRRDLELARREPPASEEPVDWPQPEPVLAALEPQAVPVARDAVQALHCREVEDPRNREMVP